MDTTNRGVSAKQVQSHLNWLYPATGLAALVLSLIFLVGLVSLVAASLRSGALNGWLAGFQDVWLLILFRLNAGFAGIQFDRLARLNPLDIAILVLMGMTCLGLYVALRRAGRIWSLVAAAMPFLGILIFLITKLTGRSAVMGAGLIFSGLMLRSKVFGRGIAGMGIAANVLLLAGDFGTTGVPSPILAAFVGLGYMLLMGWFFLVGQRLFRINQGSATSEA